MSALTGYVMLMVTDLNGVVKLFGSPIRSDVDDLVAIDEITEVNGLGFSSSSFFRILQHTDQSIKSKKVLKLHVRRGRHSTAHTDIPENRQAVAFGIEETGQERLKRLYHDGCIEKIHHYDMPKDVRQILTERPLYVTDFIKENLSSFSNSQKKLARDISTLSLCHVTDSKHKPKNTLARRLSSSLTNSGRFDWKITSLLDKMATATPVPRHRYKLNGNYGTGSILPPDENTHEMAVDCPPSYVAAHPPMSGRSTPQVEAPPPTPLDSSAGQKSKTSSNLQDAATKAATLPQPEMNFVRIHRMRESANRKKEQRSRDERVRQHMAKEDGAKKLQSLQHLTPEEQIQKRKKGVENPTYVRDSYIENGTKGSRAPVLGIEGMFSSLSDISSKIEDEELSNDLFFLRKLIQDDSFQEALDLHKTIVQSTTPQSSAALQPVLKDMQHVVTDVHEELIYNHLPQSSELKKLLSKPHFKGLTVAHDGSATLLEPPSVSNPYEDINVHNAEDEEIIRRVSQYTEKGVRVARIEKSTEALGATVRCEEDGSVTIGRIVSGGAVGRSNLLREGDEVIEVNGKSMRGLDVNEVGDAIAAMHGTLVFVLATPSKPVNGISGRNGTEVVKHVRALFDYDAIDDPYLPCKELGLSFQKGDVLRIMSTDDPDWWQAYRDEDDDTHLTLAGLIPSHEFQHQREALRIAMTKESEAPESKKTLFCGRKKKEKKKVSDLYDENNEDELIQTYEEMALYHQPEGKKRPIVLIGPPNVGRHELRQRLVDNDRDRFASPISLTTRPPNEGEREGIDYHFVSHNAFQAIIEQNGLVEYGSFQKTLYGTSIEAVRRVIEAKKICVLNLHAESLRSLCASDLKPYIVFVGPPPLDRLRQNMGREGKQLKEDELRNIIENARDIERQYAHFFDETIRNVDLNRSYAELLRLINKLDSEPQWVPASWLDNGGQL